MPELLLVSTLTVALAMGALVLVLATSLRPARSRSLANLQRGLVEADASDAAARTSSLEELARRITLPSLVAGLERQHARAGRPADWPVGRLLTLKLIWVVAAVALLVLLIASKQQPILLLLLVAFAVIVYFVPDLLLLSRGQERDQDVQRQLADTLDQMTIAVEAGLGFDAAMSRAAANGKGALAEELTRTLQDMRMGRSRREAYEDLAERNQVADLRQFVRAILQADAFGISIGDVLRTQAGEMRLKRRQRAEEKAQQVPVKVLMPLMLCILPVLFIVVLGPAGIGMYLAFSG
ncbi:MAG: type II secretion system F family protein [Actinomycetes bacterium]